LLHGIGIVLHRPLLAVIDAEQVAVLKIHRELPHQPRWIIRRRELAIHRDCIGGLSHRSAEYPEEWSDGLQPVGRIVSPPVGGANRAAEYEIRFRRTAFG